jgi:oxygen-dependent protoporphyrinogen oxidase
MRVVVVGAGPAGLAAAFGLAARGADVTVFERASEIGGRVRTLVSEGRQIELGPAGILDDAPDTRALLGALGDRAPRVIEADPIVKRRYLVRSGVPRALPTAPPGLLFGRALGIGARLGLLREFFVGKGDARGETIAAFARRRVGRSLAESLVQPAVVGVFGGDYEALELESCFPRIAALEAQHGSVLRGMQAENKGQPRARLTSFEGGMGALPRALADALGDRVRVGVRVQSIERARDGWRVLAGEATTECDRLLIATETEAAATLLAPVDARAGELLRAIPFVAMASVCLAYRREHVGHALDGFGVLVGRRERMKTLGVLFMTSIFPTAEQTPPGEVLLRVMMGGVNDPGIDALDDATVLAVAERELASLLRISAPARFRHVQRWPRAIPQYVLGHAERARELEARLPPGLAMAGTALHGVGVNDVLRDAARAVERLSA